MDKSKAGKILGLFIIISLGFIIFLSRIADIITSDGYRATPQKKEVDSGTRGDIKTSDGYHLTRTVKDYSVIVNPSSIEPTKKELFIKFFCIYSKLPENFVRAELDGDKRVVLLKNIDARSAKNFSELSRMLDKMHVFVPRRIGFRYIRYGLEVQEDGLFRSYPYKDLLEPTIGFVKNDSLSGVMGLEKSYNEKMQSVFNGSAIGYRDVGGNVVYNKKIEFARREDGTDVTLWINMRLQKSVEKIIDDAKKELGAAEILAAVMSSSDGKLLALAASNRYDPSSMTDSTAKNMRMDFVQYSYEPGSTIKPIVFSLLLEKGLVNRMELIDGHYGKYKIGNKVITDEHKMKVMTAEDAVVYSSNIGMSQLAQRLPAVDFKAGLERYGFGKRSGLDLPYEQPGDTPHKKIFESQIYKATLSYGYGLLANFSQLLSAYNVFNNGGMMVKPTLVSSVDKKPTETWRVVSSTTAANMKAILKNVVEKGTGTKAKVEGLDIGGKTGTAHIAKNGVYTHTFNSSFFGYVNSKSKLYTIGILVIEPVKAHFAADTAVPVFKKIVYAMGDAGVLEMPKPQPKVAEQNTTR